MARIKRVLAFDVGGTKIGSAVVELASDGYEILDYEKSETPQDKEELIALLLELVRIYRGSHKFDRIGIAFAGQINFAGDTVLSAPNLNALGGCKLGKLIARKTGLEVVMKNDVRAFACGEDAFGKFRGRENAVFMTLGTGIGGAIKLGGKFQSGHDNIAGEFGHMAVEADGVLCGCGRRGCWEKYVGGSALVRMYEDACGENKNAQDILAAAAAGSVKDKEIVLCASSYLAAGLVTLVNVLNPEVIVIGGSMIKGKLLLDLALPLVRKEALLPGRKTKIVASSLGDKAALLGAAII